MKRIFQRGPSVALRLVIALTLAAAFLILDGFYNLVGVKAYLQDITSPIFTAANAPDVVADKLEREFISRDELLAENAELRTENLILHGKVQTLAALTIENVRLRELLNSTTRLDGNVLVAEIIAISPDPFQHFVMLNKGTEDGVYVGQAVIDANGLFGQVVEVASESSRVLLISDERHAVPVQVDRNGVRLIAEGQSEVHEMVLPHVALTTDIVPGDVISTSGLGGVFPKGYPVARITEVRHDPGQAFAIVKARPFAHLTRSSHVLLLFNKKQQNES